MSDADESADGIEKWEEGSLSVWEVHLVYSMTHESPNDESLTVMAPDNETAVSEARRVSDGNPPKVGPVYNDGDKIVSVAHADNSDRFGNPAVTDGGFNEVCDECGRHVAVAGHDPDCPEADDDE